MYMVCRNLFLTLYFNTIQIVKGSSPLLLFLWPLPFSCLPFHQTHRCSNCRWKWMRRAWASTKRNCIRHIEQLWHVVEKSSIERVHVVFFHMQIVKLCTKLQTFYPKETFIKFKKINWRMLYDNIEHQ